MNTNLQIPASPLCSALGLEVIGLRCSGRPRAHRLRASRGVSESRRLHPGRIITAMLDDCMGPAVWFHSCGHNYSVTVGMNVNFLRAARLGRIVGEAQVLQLGKTIGFVEGRLFDAEHHLLAHATASVRLVAAARLAVADASV